MMRVLFLNTPRLINLYWHSASALLEEVVEEAARGEFTLADLTQMVKAGTAIAGVVYNDLGEPILTVVFEFRFYPRKQVINIMALGGRQFHLATGTFWPQFVAWAKEYGVTEIEACTSPAMTRLLRGLGFQHTYDLVRLPC